MKYSIRSARAQDCRDIERMIMELALYEKMPDQVKISHKGHTVVGYVLYYYTYSTWSGRCIYMEDLYVMPQFRGEGIGKALMASVAKVCREQQCVRLQFSVLDWNKPSLEFYLSKGAQDLTDKEGWHLLRFDGEALESLAEEAP
ncbi:diamine acetyltransferase 2b isoform X2 [Pygocentrus nattereri]|uniref:diamine acetyltransferase 2b isoform X2 n=1 Tax=Pygocentrus nattereri TaxID=42514 RepID=UPI001891EAD3|nr:diamine acetyltransferase 2b isoform X2 [Pygocentrus nattereri]